MQDESNILRIDLLHAHGTRYRYQYTRCRCPFCRGAQADYRRRRHDASPTEIDAYFARYRESHREAIRESGRGYYSRTTERHAERTRQYRQKNRDKVEAQIKRWREEHPELVFDQWRASAHARRARAHASHGHHTAADIAAQRQRQHGRCYWCHEKTGRSYHADHVIPLALDGSDGPENLVIACASCNHSKGAKHPMEWAGRLC